MNVGGSPEYTLTEDYALGMELKMKGWQCRYVNEALAIGEVCFFLLCVCGVVCDVERWVGVVCDTCKTRTCYAHAFTLSPHNHKHGFTTPPHTTRTYTQPTLVRPPPKNKQTGP